MRASAILIALLAAACGGNDPQPPPDDEHSHDHADDGKYGGHMLEIGDHLAWVEVVYVAETGTITAHVWDSHVTGPRRLKAASLSLAVGEATYELKPVTDELTGDKPGDCARFEVQSDALKDLEHFDGVLGKLKMGGEEFPEQSFHYHR